MTKLLRLLVLVLAGLAGQAYAACTSPAGQSGDVVYASNISTMVYCNGSNWISMAGGVSTTVNIGGSTATPAGNNTEIQFNTSGAFGSSSNFTYSGGLVTLTGTISSTNGYFGTVSATTYYGDGSHLTGVGAGDRITSGTTSMVVNSATSIISITNAGVTAGYFNSNGVLTVPGISATANLTSLTSLYASGLVGIGTSTPSGTLDISASNTPWAGQIRLQAKDFDQISFYNSAASAITQANRKGDIYYDVVNSKLVIENQATPSVTLINPTGGNVGVGTSMPSATLDVGGTISATAIQVKPYAVTCATSISGTMRYSAVSSTMEYCNGSAWVSMGPSATTPVAFSVNRNGVNQTVTANTLTKIQFTNKVFDTNSNFDATTNYRFTPTVPGYYLLTLQVHCSDGTSYCQSNIYRNGALASGTFAAAGGVGNSMGVNTAILYMNGLTDYVEGYVTNSPGTTISGIITNTYFSGVLLAPQGGGAGGASPAGSTADVQYNSGGSLAADTGNFTYSGGLLTAPRISASAIYVTGTSGIISATYMDANTISATTYYGDGSHLTGVGAGDRIVSGTGNSVGLIANSNTNIISITTNGTVTGYFNSNGVLTVPGISATANLTSVTTLFASGRINGSTISASTAIQVGSNALTCATGISGTMRYSQISSTMEYCNGSVWTSMGPSATSPVAFWVTNNADETVTTVHDGSVTKLTFNTKNIDTNNNFSTGTSQFTPTVPGYYLVNLNIDCSTNASNWCYATIHKNGSSYSQQQGPIGNGFIGSNISTIMYLNGTTDYAEAYAAAAASGTVRGITTQTYFWGVLLAPQGGGATPAGSSADVQFNSGGALGADSGNFIYASSVLKAPTVSATSVYAANVSATNIKGTLTTAAQGNVTSLGTLSALTMGGTITMGGNNITGGGTANFTSLGGTLTTAAQGNITSLGTLSGLTMNGDINMNSHSVTNAGQLAASSAAGIVVYGNTTNATGGNGVYGANSGTGYLCYMGSVNYSLSCAGPTSGVSDRRLKKEITPLDPSMGLAAIMKLKPVRYRWRDERMNKTNRKEIGFIAQNVESVLPELVGEVTQASDTRVPLPGHKSKALEYDRLIAPAILAIQQLKIENDDLKAEFEAYKLAHP